MCLRVKNVKIPPADGASIELTIARAASCAPTPVRARDDPPLNISHPNQSINVPSTAC